jgi:hypothetical protein
MASFAITARADVIWRIAKSMEASVVDNGASKVITVTIDDNTGGGVYVVTDPNGKKRSH